MVESVCNVAKSALCRYYAAEDALPYSGTIAPAGSIKLRGSSFRYAAISQIGIGRWLRFHPEDASCLPNLWARIAEHTDKADHIGDYALALWAGLESRSDSAGLFAPLLAQGWQDRPDSCDAVELGWIVQACALARQKTPELDSYLAPLLAEAKDRLLALFDHEQRLFRRHNRHGFHRAVSRRIACFADQVYPILALSNFGSAFDDSECVALAAEATERICGLQGPLGQWWWHYDTHSGKICEEYPVFSVHQDGMAPMAIRASDRAADANHLPHIESGLRWLFGANELGEHMISGTIIWRDIERREPAKLSRSLRAALCVAGARPLHRLAGTCFRRFRINRECRPYHLGWALYAWADFDRQKKRAPQTL